MLIEENEKKRQAQLANTAPVVHAPPVVQPVVQPGYVQPQVVQGGYGQDTPPRGLVVGAAPTARQVAPATRPPVQVRLYAPQGTVVQGATSPRATSPKGTEHTPNSPQTPGPMLSKSPPAALSRSPLALLK